MAFPASWLYFGKPNVQRDNKITNSIGVLLLQPKSQGGNILNAKLDIELNLYGDTNWRWWLSCRDSACICMDDFFKLVDWRCRLVRTLATPITLHLGACNETGDHVSNTAEIV